MQQELTRARELLTRQALRLTPQREGVLRVLLEHPGEHLSAEEVYLRARRRSPALGLATVYRTLEVLVQLGLAYRLERGDGQSLFEYSPGPDGPDHHHLICLACGRIRELPLRHLPHVAEAAHKAAGFVLADRCLRLFGYCRDCAGAAS